MEFNQKVGSLPELVKLENAVFVLPFVYIALLLSNNITIFKFILITAALLTARSAAFAMNRYIGRNIDMENPKKKDWSSVKVYSKIELLVIFLVFVAIFELCTFLLNPLALLLSPIVLVLIVIEPFAKRYTEHRHFFMAFVIGLGIIGGYIGATGQFPQSPTLYILFIGYIFFSASNDILYTMSHTDFDKEHGLKTYPVSFGKDNAVKYSLIAHMIASVLFVLFAILLNSPIVLVGAIIATMLLLMEHRALMRSKDTNDRLLKLLFFNYNAYVSLILFFSVALSRLL